MQNDSSRLIIPVRPHIRFAAYGTIVIMSISAILHFYWAFGGMWFLVTMFDNSEVTFDITLKILSAVFALCMLTAVYLALVRINIIKSILTPKLIFIALRIYTIFMLGGAIIDLSEPGVLNRFVFAPIFLICATMGLILGWPLKTTTTDN